MSDITLRQIPIGEYEYVDVEFSQANVDVVVKYQRLRTDDVHAIRWLDVSQGGTAAGSAAVVYRVIDQRVPEIGPGFVLLRSTVAGYKTRLLLFTERM